MLRTPHRLRIALFSLPLFFLVSTTHAQTPSPNADILKMIQAGLPESAILNKIQQGAGQWDTSVDALIALKQAGATPAEITALTSSPPSPVVVAQAPPPPSTPAVVQVLGGYLTNHGGDYTLFEPGASPNADELSNMLFHIVVVDRHPALRLSVRADYITKPRKDSCFTWGDLIFEHDKLTYYPYGRINWEINIQKSGMIAPDPSLKPIVLPMASVKLPTKKGFYGRVHLTGRNMDSDAEYPYSFAWGVAFSDVAPNMPSEEFLRALVADFDGTMAQLLYAAALTDPDHQLGPESHFTPPTPAEIPAILVGLNRDVARWRTALDETFKTQRQLQQASNNGGGFLALMNVMQGVTNMASAQSAANIAAANHDMAGQLNAAMNAGKAEAQTLNAINNPNAAPIQTLAPPDPNAIQNTLAQQQAAIAVKAAQAAKPVQTASTKSTYSYDPAPPSPPKIALSSGTAPPPTCVDLGPGNCMPIAQYQQMLAQQKAQAQQVAANNTQICPPSGIVPGPGHYAACDAYIGQQVSCVPGHLVPIAVPPPPPASCGPVNTPAANPNTPAVGSGEGNAMGCMIFTPDNQGNVNVQNNCPFTVHYYWVGYNDPGSTKNDVVQAGGTDQFSPGGQYRVYACNNAYFTDGPDGRIVHGIVDNFMCVKK